MNQVNNGYVRKVTTSFSNDKTKYERKLFVYIFELL